VESGDKEKYPNLYLASQINEKLAEALDLPKEMLCKLIKPLFKVILK